MANANNPHGLWPLGISLSGGPQDIEQFTKPATDAVAIFRNDPVVRAGNALTATATPGTSVYQGVALEYGAANTLTTHNVVISPDALYEAQVDGTAITSAQLGDNANLNIGGGSALTKVSGATINGASAAVTATLDVKLLQLYPIPNNAIGAYARIEIVFNKHRMVAGALGA